MRFSTVAVLILSALALATLRAAGQPNPSDLPKPLELTSQEDHKKMMEQLKIKELRRGADGNNPKSPNASNTDESKASPYKTLPDSLVFDNGKPVKTADDWKKRRAEILEHFDREVYGRVP